MLNQLETDSPTPVKTEQTSYGFSLEDAFKIATKFFKENEGKVFHPSYAARNHSLALVLQAKHGPFDENRASPLGALDIVGRDRRLAWAELGNITSDQAKEKFIKFLEESCPLFKPFIEAHQKEKEERQKLKNCQSNGSISSHPIGGKDLDLSDRTSGNPPLVDKFISSLDSLTEEQKKAIKDWLNSQTLSEFQKNAESLFPDDKNRQLVHIKRLQEQHFEQFMFQQLTLTMNGTQNETKNGSNHESPLLRDGHRHVSYHSTLIPSTSVKRDDNYNPNLNMNSLKQALEPTNMTYEGSGSAQAIQRDDSVDRKNSEFTTIEAPQMWTKDNIKEFKESAKSNGGMMTINHGDIVTIRVPTFPEGSSISWEFATDSYDIAFGLSFQWMENPGDQVSIHYPDSDDDDDSVEESVVPIGHDPENGNQESESNAEDDSSVDIIPTHRRESHEHVFYGSHSYPGNGVYYFRFDNTYSFFRSKNLYYKIYYNKE